MAFGHDPATYPRLLAEFEANPREDLYDSLVNLPGLAGPLPESVDRLCTNHVYYADHHLQAPGPVLGLAFHFGRPGALPLAYRLLRESRPVPARHLHLSFGTGRIFTSRAGAAAVTNG